MQRDLLVERIAARQEAARERAAAIRAKLPEVAALLRARGATRVVVFGSMAPRGTPHEASDVDLAVWGLDPRGYFKAIDEVAVLLGTDLVDLVEMEKSAPALAARVAETGVEL